MTPASWVFDVAGPVDANALGAALGALVARHPILRGGFEDGRVNDGRVEGRVENGRVEDEEADTAGVLLTVLDRRAMGEGERTVADCLAAQSSRPFDLSGGPLLRAVLVLLSAERSVFVLTVHRDVVDQWSGHALMRDLGACYGTACQGTGIQHASPASWQAKQLGDRLRVAEAVPLVLDREAADDLLRVRKTFAASPFTVLLTAFQLTTGLHAGADGRRCRTVWDESVSFGDLLARAQDTPQLPSDVLPGLSIVERFPTSRVAEFDLTVTWDAAPDESGVLHGWLEYDADLFARPTAQRMAAHYLALLRSALAEPDAPVRGLSHTTSEELALLRRWAEAPLKPTAENVVAEVLRRAAETPDAPALDFEDDRLSYAQLVERSGRMAEALAAHGVVAEDVVGLALERSASLVVAMLAVLMSGAAYLPLDAGYPDSRLAHMVANSGAALVIADRDVAAFAGSVPVFRVEELLCLEGHQHAAAPREAFAEPSADQRACLLYTSGSTGLPKGVEVTHGGIVRLVRGGPYFRAHGPGRRRAGRQHLVRRRHLRDLGRARERRAAGRDPQGRRTEPGAAGRPDRGRGRHGDADDHGAVPPVHGHRSRGCSDRCAPCSSAARRPTRAG